MLADGSAEIGMLPEPNVTSTLAGNDDLRIALNLTEEWNKVCSTELVQGVVIARKSFVNEHPEAIEQFLREYEKSSAFVNENIDEAAKLIVDAGILGNVEIAKKQFRTATSVSAKVKRCIKRLKVCSLFCLRQTRRASAANSPTRIFITESELNTGYLVLNMTE